MAGVCCCVQKATRAAWPAEPAMLPGRSQLPALPILLRMPGPQVQSSAGHDKAAASAEEQEARGKAGGSSSGASSSNSKVAPWKPHLQLQGCYATGELEVLDLGWEPIHDIMDLTHYFHESQEASSPEAALGRPWASDGLFVEKMDDEAEDSGAQEGQPGEPGGSSSRMGPKGQEGAGSSGGGGSGGATTGQQDGPG